MTDEIEQVPPSPEHVAAKPDAAACQASLDAAASGVVDLRSDTVTRPTTAMRAVMQAAMSGRELGDDGFRDDPTQLALEAEIAALLGKEAALFVPSGVMANQLAIRLQTQPGDEVLVHAASHILDHEYSGAAAISGVMLRPLDSLDGSLDLTAVAERLTAAAAGRSAPVSLVCVENTHNDRGGLVLPHGYAEALAALVRPHGVRLHLDGARLFNAAVATGRSLADLAAPFDTVSVCMSKGLGAPVGSLLVGSRAQCERAVRIRRYLGGLMRQTGFLAAAARHALAHHIPRLADAHRRAAKLGAALAALADVDVVPVQTNLVRFSLRATHPLRLRDAAERSTRSEGETQADELVTRLDAAGVRITGDGVHFRAVTHLDINDPGLNRAIATLTAALSGATHAI